MDPLIERAGQRFALLLEQQLRRVELMKQAPPPLDYGQLAPLIIGLVPGDGIGPIISRETLRVLRKLLRSELAEERIELRTIEGLTLENRVLHLKAIPEDVLQAIKDCHVILKGPTTTPEKGGPYPNIESANVAMRRELDLFANVRPVQIPDQGLDWVFFRENTEGPYLLGSQGVQVTEDLAIDFSVASLPGSERIIRAAFEYARQHGVDRVFGVTKANVIKATDGLFLQVGERISKEYPGIRWESWYADIVAAKLIDPKRRQEFRVFVLPNLYGDILTDEAAELQGGVGTAGSANLGTRYAMFEAIHGSGLRMMAEGRGDYADPSSLLRAASMMLRHVGLTAKADTLDMVLDLAIHLDRQVEVTGRPDGATAQAFTDHVLRLLDSGQIASRWAILKEHRAKLAVKKREICSGEMDAFGNLVQR